ncbi:MAG: hypothetical protein JXO44_06730 [Clostridia bacterium]|nr:hypothetical protein [Clostridia bacterium]
MDKIKVIFLILLSLSFLIFAVLLNVGIIDHNQYDSLFMNPLNYLLMAIAVIGFLKRKRGNL